MVSYIFLQTLTHTISITLMYATQDKFISI